MNTLTLAQLQSTGRPPDVSFVIGSLAGGGAQRVVLDLCAALAADGVLVDLVVLKDVGEFRGGVAAQVRYVNLQATPLTCLVRYGFYLARARPRRVVANTENVALVCALASLIRHQYRLYIRVDGRLARHRPVKQRWFGIAARLKLFLARRLYGRAEKVIAVSNGLRTELTRSLGLSEARCVAIYNAVPRPLVLTAPASQAGDRTSPSNASAPGVAHLISVGRLVQEKAHDMLIQSAAIVNEQRACRLTILGEGPRRHYLEQLVKRLGLEDQVLLPGFRANVADYLSASDLFVMSSVSEGLPLVILEALHCNLPVVSTDCCYGPRELLDHGKFGMLVPLNDPRSMADAILAALARSTHTPPQRYRDAHALHLQQFALDQIVTRYRHTLDV